MGVGGCEGGRRCVRCAGVLGVYVCVWRVTTWSAVNGADGEVIWHKVCVSMCDG